MSKQFTITIRPASDIETHETVMSVTVTGFGTLPFSDKYKVHRFLQTIMNEIEGIVGGIDKRWKLLLRAQNTTDGWFSRYERLRMIE